MKEEKDSGQLPMIHLSHQLPGVKVCPKHNAKLHQYYLKDMGRFPFGFEKYDEIDQTQLSDFDYRFAVFMCELSKLKMNYSLYDLISDINEKMNDKYAPYYLKETSDDQLVCLYNKYLCNGGFVLATNNVLDLFKLMYFIYHDPKNILIIPKNEHFKAFNDKIYGKYELVGDYSESVVELRCLNCKETFITSPRLILNQHECPHCKALTQKYYYNLITHYVNNVYEGKYKFVRYDYKEQIVVVYHSKTGKTLNFDVFRFITKYLNRQNRKIIPIDYAWGRYSNYGTYDRYLKGEFLIRQASKEYFLNEMFDLVADEYQLVGEYENMFSEVELRHSLCGKVLRVKPYDFLNGKRCENCKVKHSAEVITDFLNRMIPGYHFISNYEHSINSYLFRAIQYKYSYRIASVERIYQFTEEILIQEILRINKKTQMFRTVKLNPVIFHEFFFQKDINTVSNGKEGEDGETYVP